MEGGLRLALAALLLVAQVSALQYAVTSFTTTNTYFLVTGAVLTSLGQRTVTMIVPVGFYQYLYSYTEPFTTTFYLTCSGEATLIFLTPTAVITANVIETVISNVTSTTFTSTVRLSLPSYFYYLLGGTESSSEALVTYSALTTTPLSTVSAAGTGSLVGSAVLTPRSYVVCTYSPAPRATVFLFSGRKVTLEGSVTTISAPYVAEAALPLSVTVTTAFPVSASVEGAVTQGVYEFLFYAPEPQSTQTPLLVLGALGLIALIKRYSKE